MAGEAVEHPDDGMIHPDRNYAAGQVTRVVVEQPGVVVYPALYQGTGQVAGVNIEELVGEHCVQNDGAGQVTGEVVERHGDQHSSICVPHLTLFQLVWYRL